MMNFMVRPCGPADHLEDLLSIVETELHPFKTRPEIEKGTVIFNDLELAANYTHTIFGISVGESMNLKIPHDHLKGFNECLQVHTVKFPVTNETAIQGVQSLTVKGFSGLKEVQDQRDMVIFTSYELAFNFLCSKLMEAGLVDEGESSLFEE